MVNVKDSFTVLAKRMKLHLHSFHLKVFSVSTSHLCLILKRTVLIIVKIVWHQLYFALLLILCLSVWWAWFAAVVEAHDLRSVGLAVRLIQILHPSAVLQHHYSGPGALTQAHCRSTRNATGGENERGGSVERGVKSGGNARGVKEKVGGVWKPKQGINTRGNWGKTTEDRMEQKVALAEQMIRFCLRRENECDGEKKGRCCGRTQMFLIDPV